MIFNEILHDCCEYSDNSFNKRLIVMKKLVSMLFAVVVASVFACNSGNKNYDDSDSSSMSTPDTMSRSDNNSNNMNNMPTDTMRQDTAMKR